MFLRDSAYDAVPQLRLVASTDSPFVEFISYPVYMEKSWPGHSRQNSKISPKKQQEILPPPLFPTARAPLWKTPPRRGDFSIRLSVVELFALDSGPLRSNELSIHSLN